jgi:hypothetical protein
MAANFVADSGEIDRRADQQTIEMGDRFTFIDLVRRETVRGCIAVGFVRADTFGRTTRFTF